jgi:HlyD family secretion protein
MADASLESPPDLAADRRRHRLRRAQWVLLGAVAASMLLSAGGLIGAAWVKSPAQVAAQTSAPSPSLLTATVSRQVVSKNLISRGIVTAAQEVQFTPESEPGAQRLVISAMNKPAGAAVDNGDVLLAVSGRPLFSLLGDVPAWRDLTPGESGSDVAQLQAALADLGYPFQPDPSGTFGQGTKNAVAAFYARIGFPVLTSGASAAQLQQAQQAITTASQRLAADQRSAGQGGTAGQAAQARLTADQAAVTAAQQSYDNMAEHSGPMVPMSEVVFVPSFPATVAAVSGQLGSLVQAPLITIDAGRPDIVAQLDPSDEPLVRAGQAVAVQDEASGWQATGTIESVGAVTTTGGSGSGSAASASTGGAGSGSSGASPGSSAGGSGTAYLPVIIAVTGTVPTAEISQNVQVTVTYASSAGPVLAVPEAAIRTDAAGRTYLLAVNARGGQQRVPVATGITGGGMVAVTAQEGMLTAGQKVVTGS